MSTLREELALGDKPLAPSGGDGGDEGLFGETTRPKSPTALELDNWALRRGREVCEAYAEQLGEKVSPEAAADFHAAAFEPNPKLAKDCADESRHKFMRDLLDSPGYEELHRRTQLDTDVSELAALSFAQNYIRLVEEREKAQQQQGGKGGKGKPSPGAPDVKGMAAASQAIQQASQEVDSLEDTANALGCGSGMGGGSKVEGKRVASLFKRVRDSSKLRRICELAGKYRRVAQSRQRQKTLHGMDDTVGVELSGDVHRLLPQEAVSLVTEELEWDALRRLAEGQMLSREYRAIESMGRGPLIVLVDESGSTSGDLVCHEKALALALAWVARHQRRWCWFLPFSDGVGPWLYLPPDKWDEGALCQWLESFIGGGTSLFGLMHEVPDVYAQRVGEARQGRVDIVMITDGVVSPREDWREKYSSFRAKTGAKVTTLIVGGHDPAPMREVSDVVHVIPSLDSSEESVGDILGL